MRRTACWVPVVVEIPRGSREKYECDHHARQIVLDRVLPASLRYPTVYGFISIR